MLDLSHIPNSQQDIKVFYSNGDTNAWQTWQKPRKCQWVWIMTIGSGGGGGGGAVGTSGNQMNATGGGSGGVTRTLFNASLLPDTVYVQIGIGGTGGLGGGVGSTGTVGKKSYVSILPNITIQNLVSTSGAASATGGQVGAATNLGETIATATNATFLTLGTFIGLAGVTATQGAKFQDPPLLNLPPLTSQITCAGGAGAYGQAGVSPVNGAGFTSTSYSPQIDGGIGSQFTGGDGTHGVTIWKPFFSVGGAGGGSGYDSVSGIGGNGGNGGIGSGGGGGGCGVLDGGNGGNGGDGLVVIISF